MSERVFDLIRAPLPATIAEWRERYEALSAGDMKILEKRFGDELTQKQIDALGSFIRASFGIASIRQWAKENSDQWTEIQALEANAK